MICDSWSVEGISQRNRLLACFSMPRCKAVVFWGSENKVTLTCIHPLAIGGYGSHRVKEKEKRESVSLLPLPVDLGPRLLSQSVACSSDGVAACYY